LAAVLRHPCEAAFTAGVFGRATLESSGCRCLFDSAVRIRGRCAIWRTAQSGHGEAIERQVEIVIEQMKTCLLAAGSSLEKVIKCTV
jgi:enamine deaminase RidA (YjgF/YER057c/UK114 family)